MTRAVTLTARVDSFLILRCARALGEQLEHTISLWSGLCAVRLTVAPDLVEMRGPRAHDVCRVVEEAINNAITHGEASEVGVTVEESGDAVIVDVSDDGVGPRDGDPGLGSTLLDSICDSWELTAETTGSRMYARIAGT